MPVEPDNIDELLSAIRSTISENRKFLLNLESEDDLVETVQLSGPEESGTGEEEAFEEL